MADLKVRNLDDVLVDALRRRAKQHGVSLEEEARRTLADSFEARREKFFRRAAAIRAAIGEPGDPSLDSAIIIREERDAWG